jgi:MFS transporter, SP family, galactose:H+ symporter
MLTSALCGINTVIFYSTTIFDFAGFHESILATASVGAVNFVTTSSAAYFVDRMGRKSMFSTI